MQNGGVVAVSGAQSVEAFAPSGTQEIPGSPGRFEPLGDGGFRFQFGGDPVGPSWVVPAGFDERCDD